MTPTTAEFLLIVAAVIPITCGIGAALAVASGMRTTALTLGRIGFAGGAVFGIVLAWMLKVGPGGVEQEIHLRGWTWFSFPGAYGPTVKFGLAATWTKSLAMGIGGLLALLTTWSANSSAPRRLSDNALISATMLYASSAVFVFSPNAVQGFIGWAAVSLFAAVLLRLARNQWENSDAGQPIRINSAQTSLSKTPTGNVILRLLEAMGKLVVMLERVFAGPIGETTFRRIPVWTAEQLDLIECSPLSTQLIVAVLGAFAVLLTWLI